MQVSTYGSFEDSLDDLLRLVELTILQCLNEFASAVLRMWAMAVYPLENVFGIDDCNVEVLVFIVSNISGKMRVGISF